MDKPLVSVILTTRDRPNLLPVALECYRRQTYPNRELIVVDDGDQFPVSAAFLSDVGGRLVQVPPGIPLGTKLNRGIEAAKGFFCQKMDDDDFYAANYIESMVAALKATRQDSCEPSFAFMMPFLFFELAKWEIRRSISRNIPGASLVFAREDWLQQPFRNVRFDEDTWFYLDRLRSGLKPVPVDSVELFLAVRHGSSQGDRGHTWQRQWNGRTLESYLEDRPLYERTPEEVLPEWVLPIYRKLA